MASVLPLFIIPLESHQTLRQSDCIKKPKQNKLVQTHKIAKVLSHKCGEFRFERSV